MRSGCTGREWQQRSSCTVTFTEQLKHRFILNPALRRQQWQTSKGKKIPAPQDTQDNSDFQGKYNSTETWRSLSLITQWKTWQSKKHGQQCYILFLHQQPHFKDAIFTQIHPHLLIVPTVVPTQQICKLFSQLYSIQFTQQVILNPGSSMKFTSAECASTSKAIRHLTYVTTEIFSFLKGYF